MKNDDKLVALLVTTKTSAMTQSAIEAKITILNTSLENWQKTCTCVIGENWPNMTR
jgi:hypothetical protein